MPLDKFHGVQGSPGKAFGGQGTWQVNPPERSLHKIRAVDQFFDNVPPILSLILLYKGL